MLKRNWYFIPEIWMYMLFLGRFPFGWDELFYQSACLIASFTLSAYCRET